DRDTVMGIIENHKVNPGARLLQKTLAREVTQIVHGRDRRESVEKVTGLLFGTTDISDLNDADFNELSSEIPVTTTGGVVDALVATGLASSNGEARKLIQNNAVSVNGEKITDSITVQS